MKLPVVWLPEADAELKEARAWYDSIRPTLGDRFALAVEATIEAIAETPLQFPIVHRGRRRAGVRRFPYGIFFEVHSRRSSVVGFRSRESSLVVGPLDDLGAGCWSLAGKRRHRFSLTARG